MVVPKDGEASRVVSAVHRTRGGLNAKVDLPLYFKEYCVFGLHV